MKIGSRMRSQFKPLRQQRGVALITAILLVALATALAAKLTWDNYLSMRRTESGLTMEQARLIALGAEATIIGLMRMKDPEFDDPNFDHLNEDWAREEGLAFTVGIDETDFGTMRGTLSDATARFNVNNLVSSSGLDLLAADQFNELLSVLQAKFRTDPLYRDLKLSPEITDNIIDWIDQDTIPYKSGAEDGSYTSLEIPFRPANNYMLSPSELRSVYGMDGRLYEALRPYISAIPPGWCRSIPNGPSSINLNTAPQEVLEALDPASGADWVGQAFEETSSVNPTPDATLNGYWDIKTPCFELQVTVTIGRSVLTMYSLLERSGPSGDIFTTRVRTFGLDPE